MSANVHGRVGVWTTGLVRNPHLRALLGADELVFRPGPREPVDAVIGWGKKANTEAPRRFAREHGVPFLALEDGFVRSLRPGVSGDAPLSIVVDDLGIYYDATAPSAIEHRLASIDRLEAPLLARARNAIDTMRRERISKYNDGPSRRLPPSERRRVLVVDQTAGDLSIALGVAGERPFDRMLEAALDENPDADIVIKTHPDVALGKRRANFTSIPRDARVSMLAEPVSPIELLEDVDRVYVVTSLLGLEALLSDKRVTCFGTPFYAGWGLTDDRAPRPERRRGVERSVEHLFAEAYLSYARYVDPETGRRCELERVLEHLTLQRRTADGGGRHYVCVGFSAWKRAFVPSFLGGALARVEFASDARAAERKLEPGSSIVVWGTKENDDVRALADRAGAPLRRMEDGFLRSVGLGSDLNAPASLVVDGTGIYYDPRTPSELETVLESRAFTDDELVRARALRERIVAAGISKYNLGARREVASARGDRDVVLVVGQVEDDASIRLGCVDVRTNEGLLREARHARPDAYVVWKPHPDVVRGNREGAVDPARARAWADEIVEDVALADCLAIANEVHTMTSLVGFEALLRGLRVVVYGQPFYAGWGLTEDRHRHPRRTARLTLDELVAGTLLRYPRYVSATTRRFTTPERIVDELLEGRDHARASGTATGWSRRELGKVQNLARTLIGSSSRTTKSDDDVRSIGALGCTSALLLQGPAGPFMRRLGEELRDAGSRTTKINFHAGDVLFYPGPDALAFRDPLRELPAFMRRVIDEREVDAIFLFGDCRAHHRIAIDVARELGVTVWAFEEGYLRPDWITIERDGVNGHSKLPRDPEVYLRAALPKPTPARKVGDSFGTMSWYSTLNALTFTHLNHGFPHYQHHRNLNAWFHTFSWVRGAARKQLYLRREADILPRLQGELSGRFFLAALQVHCDFQLVHSKYGDVVDFIHDVVRTFAEHADPRDSLVIKHHPMDRPFREYGPLMRDLARQHGLGERLIYVHDLHLPTLLEHARGTITINSTTALQSLHHGTPVKAMGEAIYVLPGLTFQGELAEFLSEPGTFDRALYEAFRRWLLVHNQANGSFYVRPPGTKSGTGIRWPERPDAPARRAPATTPTAPRAAPKRGSKIAKLRNSPERFFSESKSGLARALGRVVAAPIAKSELAMAILEDPLEALRERELPLLSTGAERIAQSRAATRRIAIARAGRPLVSVVVAGRNAEDCIERSIRSLLAQSHREIEVIVVDDASTDGTAEIVDAIAAQDARVRLYRNARRRRAAMSRNVGLARASGAYVTFQDADDTSHPERIERQLAALLASPDAALCVCNSRRETPDGQRVVVNGRRFARNFISMMFPRDLVFSRVGYLRELSVGEDAEYYERIRAVFGADREIHLFETLYRARFAETSLLFSHGEVTRGAAQHVTYVQSEDARRALDQAMQDLGSIRSGTSAFVPFTEETEGA